jgi:hypothetical protein
MKYTRKTPKQKKEKKVFIFKKVIKTRNMKTIIRSHSLEEGIEEEGL